MVVCAIVEKPMDEQERKMLEETWRLSRENNVKINKLLNFQRMGILWKVIYWGVIIVAVTISYLSLKPYVSGLLNVYTGADVDKILDFLPKK